MLNRLWNSSTRLTLALGLFALIAMFVVAACGDGDDDAAPAAETTSDAPEVVQGITIPPKGASTILDNIRERGELRVAVAMALPWLGQNPSNSELVGPAWTLAEKVAEILGVKITPVFTTWDALLPGALADKFDISVAATYDTPERREVVDFVNWSESGLCFSVLKASGLKTIDDLNSPNVKMVIGMGTGTEQTTRATLPEANIEAIPPSPGVSFAQNLLLAGRSDAVPFDSPMALAVEREFPDLQIIPGGAENCIANPHATREIGLFHLKNEPELNKFLQAVATKLDAQLRDELLHWSDPVVQDELTGE